MVLCLPGLVRLPCKLTMLLHAFFLDSLVACSHVFGGTEIQRQCIVCIRRERRRWCLVQSADLSADAIKDSPVSGFVALTTCSNWVEADLKTKVHCTSFFAQLAFSVSQPGWGPQFEATYISLVNYTECIYANPQKCSKLVALPSEERIAMYSRLKHFDFSEAMLVEALEDLRRSHGSQMWDLHNLPLITFVLQVRPTLGEKRWDGETTTGHSGLWQWTWVMALFLLFNELWSFYMGIRLFSHVMHAWSSYMGLRPLLNSSYIA